MGLDPPVGDQLNDVVPVLQGGQVHDRGRAGPDGQWPVHDHASAHVQHLHLYVAEPVALEVHEQLSGGGIRIDEQVIGGRFSDPDLATGHPPAHGRRHRAVRAGAGPVGDHAQCQRVVGVVGVEGEPGEVASIVAVEDERRLVVQPVVQHDLVTDEHVTRDEVDGDGHRGRGLVDEVSVLIVVVAELEIVEAAGHVHAAVRAPDQRGAEVPAEGIIPVEDGHRNGGIHSERTDHVRADPGVEKGVGVQAVDDVHGLSAAGAVHRHLHHVGPLKTVGYQLVGGARVRAIQTGYGPIQGRVGALGRAGNGEIRREVEPEGIVRVRAHHDHPRHIPAVVALEQDGRELIEAITDLEIIATHLHGAGIEHHRHRERVRGLVDVRDVLVVVVAQGRIVRPATHRGAGWVGHVRELEVTVVVLVVHHREVHERAQGEGTDLADAKTCAQHVRSTTRVGDVHRVGVAQVGDVHLDEELVVRAVVHHGKIHHGRRAIDQEQVPLEATRVPAVVPFDVVVRTLGDGYVGHDRGEGGVATIIIRHQAGEGSTRARMDGKAGIDASARTRRDFDEAVHRSGVHVPIRIDTARAEAQVARPSASGWPIGRVGPRGHGDGGGTVVALGIDQERRCGDHQGRQGTYG